ncbi:MAG TPA: hypothetical protein VK533_16465 [Sphingomonas sp.]|uniref:hypothetical protein n=1 Tax=Sphingomonas sp. TaxID=28214 RepID=UPI002CC5C0DC|nr:hypothetical protein [Sphingomonas sp.]HMI21128.1 hypothetical protein [Sphingomonas sp.]
MPDWQAIGWDPQRGIRKFIAAGDQPDSVLIRTEINDSTIVERNKGQQNEAFNRRDDMWHAASIPTSVMFEWLTRFGVNAWNPDHADAVKKLLNSSDYRWCKVKHIIL